MSFINVQIGMRSVTLNEEAFEVVHYDTACGMADDVELVEVFNNRSISQQQEEIIVNMKVGQKKTIRITNWKGHRITHTDVYEIVRGCGHKNADGTTCHTSRSCKFCLAKERRERQEKAKLDAEIRRRRSTPEWKARRAARLAKK